MLLKFSIFKCHNVLACLNLGGFIPEDWGNFLGHVGLALLTSEKEVVTDLVRIWMSDSRLMGFSDLVWFSTERPTLMLVASPFPERPFGRPLPDIDACCACDLPADRPGRLKPKTWLVRHNGEGGMNVRDIQVEVQCSSCKQVWTLETSHMVGVLCEVNGLYSVVSRYFS